MRKVCCAARLVHRLLQSLPDMSSETRLKAAQDYLARAGKDLPEADRTALAAQVMAVAHDPGFAELFAPGSRAEVPIVGRLKTAGANRCWSPARSTA